MDFNGVYGIGHIVYLVLVAIAFSVGFYFLNKHKHDERFGRLLLKSSAAVLLAAITVNRVSVTYYNIVIARNGDTWWTLLPYTFCGLSSLVLSHTVLFGKKNCGILHCIAYLGFLGGTITMFYPDFLESQTFFDIRSITGLLHHTLMVWVVIVCIKTGHLQPSLQKWHYYPLGLSLIMTFGLFEKECLGFRKAMQIGEPLLKSAPVLTAWYTVGILSVGMVLVFLFAWEKYHTKRKIRIENSERNG